jgi:hypothetical protein
VLKQRSGLAEKILSLGELNSKLMMEQDMFLKDMSLQELSTIEPPTDLLDLPREIRELEHFQLHYNKVFLDKLRLEHHLSQLTQENQFLKGQLEKYFASISIKQNVLDIPNNLFIINGKKSGNKLGGEGLRPKTIPCIEGPAHLNTYKMTIRDMKTVVAHEKSLF